MYKKIVSLSILIICGCMLTSYAYAQKANTLTPKEKKEGWKLLFNGKNLKGWHSFHQKGISRNWSVKNGTIVDNETIHGGKADLETDMQYSNFDLKLEWKMKPCSNSGVMFYVNDGSKYGATFETGPEMQIADLACKRTYDKRATNDSQIHLHRAGDLYDLAPADTEWVNAAPQWNTYEIKTFNGHVQLFENGHRIVRIKFWDTTWWKKISRTKFSQWHDFGTFRKGHISLQGTEDGQIWFRNIKIKTFRFGPSS